MQKQRANSASKLTFTMWRPLFEKVSWTGPIVRSWLQGDRRQREYGIEVSLLRYYQDSMADGASALLPAYCRESALHPNYGTSVGMKASQWWANVRTRAYSLNCGIGSVRWAMALQVRPRCPCHDSTRPDTMPWALGQEEIPSLHFPINVLTLIPYLS